MQSLSTSGYADRAPDLLVRYEALDPAEVNAHWRALFAPPPATVLDIGAGTGRDAAWLASLGYTVHAVEPTDPFRDAAMALHPEPQITWGDDALPGLTTTRASSETYDMVMLNAVWMHLDEAERTAAMPNLAALLTPKGRLYISLRHGPVPPGRRMFEVTADETIALAAAHGLTPLQNLRSGSIQAENQNRGVEWTSLVFEAP
ncbi:MAG: class I SAM-dependent methyltransferase [Pseudomonadota bacterium]